MPNHSCEGGVKGELCSSPRNGPAGEGCQEVRQLCNRLGLRGVWAADTGTLFELASCEPSWLRHLAWTHFPFLSDPFNCLLFQHSLMLTRKTGALGSKLSLPLLVLEKGVFILWRHRNLYIFYSIINSLKYHFILEIFPSWFPTLIPASSSLYPQNNIICIYWAFASLWFVIFILFLWMSHLDF